jgi:pimeloyl-ACP methyl ester carboxylesterase
MTRLRLALSVLAATSLALGGASTCQTGIEVLQEAQQIAGTLEVHTPGSGAPEEFPIPPGGKIEQILGTGVDLNHVDYVRTRVASASGNPRVILVLIPGFLGGAGTFDPIARDLVRAFGGNLEVWAVNRRSNQLEDRRGGLHARSMAEAAAGDAAKIDQALAEGVRFYFPTSDVDGDGMPDGPFPLPDALGGNSDFIKLAQDDVRFGAYWGADTYARDWRTLVLAARQVVGPEGLVIFGGHSMGTTWTGVFAAYDFDIGPGVEAGYQLVDGLLLFEGGGTRGPSASAPDEATYLAAIDDLVNDTTNVLPDSDIFLADLFGFVDAVDIGAAGELNGVAGTFAPTEPSVVQTTPLFGGIPINILLQAPMTNRSLVGFFLDDEFSTNGAFSASFGFSANGTNAFNPIEFLVPGDFYLAIDEGIRRTWIPFDSPRFDPADPNPLTCPPIPPPPFPVANVDVGETGCAIIDNGPRPAPTDPPSRWGLEREVTNIDDFTRALYETGNQSEWYFIDGRPGLDLQFGRDSSALGRPDLLNVTQNANVDVPVLAIGGSNGLAPTEASFANYLGSIASTDTTVVILEGYAHVDVLTATDNEAVPPVVDFVNRLLQQKLLGP